MRTTPILAWSLCLWLSSAAIPLKVAALDVTLRWDAVVDARLAGYRLYNRLEDQEFSINRRTDIPLAALADPAQPEYTVRGLPEGEYCFVVTSYATNEESGYSNEACTDISPPPPNEPPPPLTGLRVVSKDGGPWYRIVSGLPLDLTGSTPEEGGVVLWVDYLSAGWSMLELELTVHDADFIDEGELLINGVKVFDLFPGGNGAKDQLESTEVLSVPVEMFRQGENMLTFRHIRTAGFRIDYAGLRAEP